MPTLFRNSQTRKTEKPTPKVDESQRRKERHEVYDTRRWRKLRMSKLMAQPLCEDCLSRGKITPATQVHHVDSFMNYEGDKRLQKAYDYNNLMSLCVECHERMHNPLKRYMDEQEKIEDDEQKTVVERNKEILEAGNQSPDRNECKNRNR